MGALIILAFGVCMALLCHWMIRHTYEDWEWEEFEKPDKDGSRRKKVWNVKLSLPRYLYILLWMFCIILAPVSFIAPIILGSIIRSQHSVLDWNFHCENKLWKWMISIRD